MVFRSRPDRWNFGHPPWRLGTFDQIPVVWEYLPVSSDVRAGQQTDVGVMPR